MHMKPGCTGILSNNHGSLVTGWQIRVHHKWLLAWLRLRLAVSLRLKDQERLEDCAIAVSNQEGEMICSVFNCVDRRMWGEEKVD